MRPTLLCLVCLALGCSSGAPTPPMTVGAPHGGVQVALPDQLGSVEVAVESPGKDPGVAGQRPQSQVVAYFYAPDGSSPLTPTPSDVKAMMGGPSPMALNPQARDGFAARFASAPGAFTEEVRGTLAAEVGGRKVEVTFAKH